MQKLTKQTDRLGIIAFAGAITTFVMAVSFGGASPSADSVKKPSAWFPAIMPQDMRAVRWWNIPEGWSSARSERNVLLGEYRCWRKDI